MSSWAGCILHKGARPRWQVRTEITLCAGAGVAPTLSDVHRGALQSPGPALQEPVLQRACF